VRLHIHHCSYKHLGNEQLSELKALCEVCHSLVHLCGNIKLEQRHHVLRRTINSAPSVYEGMLLFCNAITPAVGKEKELAAARRGNFTIMNGRAY